jgi:phage terminase small subunit
VKLTQKQTLFINALVGAAKWNASKAAIIAGVPKKSAAVMGARWLRKVHIQQAVAKRVARREKQTDLTNEYIDQRVRQLAEHADDEKTQLGAWRELNKVRGRHSININLRDKTYEQLIAESRKELEE